MPNGSYTFSLPVELLAEAKEVSEVTGIPVACLVKFGLVEVIAEYEIETGIPASTQISKAVKRYMKYRKTP